MTESSQCPEVDSAACVLTASPLARCRACVDACPHEAWVLDDDSLGLDEAACDGCGVCRPACPEGAIALPLDLPLREEGDGRVTLFLACDYSDIPRASPRVACVHAVGLRDLRKLADVGLQQISVTRPDCEFCSRVQHHTLEAALAVFNALRRTRGQTVIRFERCPAEEWQEKSAASRPWQPRVDAARRQFLGLFVAGNDGADPARVTPNTTTRPEAPALLYANVPRIDTSRCNGCDACVRICPHGTLALIDSGRDPAYVIDASQCTGCGLCKDVCDQDAIAVHRLALQQRPLVPLRQDRCRVCGSPFHVPKESMVKRQVCRICCDTNHYSQLFQTYDEL